MNKTLATATLALLTAVGAHADPARLLGALDSPADATRTIVIQPGTRYINVTAGEVVNIVDEGHAFTVRFDGVRDSFLLNDLAPTGALAQPVTVYMAPNPEYDH